MSYCRLSSLSFRCDVYAYADVNGGYTIHVAASRYALPDDLVDPIAALFDKPAASPEDFARALAGHNAFQKALQDAEMEPIDAPSAGQTFWAPSLKTFRARMEALRAEGLRFPDAVFDLIDEEMQS